MKKYNIIYRFKNGSTAIGSFEITASSYNQAKQKGQRQFISEWPYGEQDARQYIKDQRLVFVDPKEEMDLLKEKEIRNECRIAA